MTPLAIWIAGLTLAFGMVRMALRLSAQMNDSLKPMRAGAPREGGIKTLRRDPATGVYRPE